MLRRGALSFLGTCGTILELDGYWRLVAMRGDELPLLLFLDIAAAFPSLSQEFLFAALEAVRMPPVALRLVAMWRREPRGAWGAAPPRGSQRPPIMSIARCYLYSTVSLASSHDTNTFLHWAERMTRRQRGSQPQRPP